jgi:hypothetical protein
VQGHPDAEAVAGPVGIERRAGAEQNLVVAGMLQAFNWTVGEAIEV